MDPKNCRRSPSMSTTGGSRRVPDRVESLLGAVPPSGGVPVCLAQKTLGVPSTRRITLRTPREIWGGLTSVVPLESTGPLAVGDEVSVCDGRTSSLDT